MPRKRVLFRQSRGCDRRSWVSAYRGNGRDRWILMGMTNNAYRVKKSAEALLFPVYPTSESSLHMRSITQGGEREALCVIMIDYHAAPGKFILPITHYHDRVYIVQMRQYFSLFATSVSKTMYR